MGMFGTGMTCRRVAAHVAASALFSLAAIAPRGAMARIHNCEHASLLPEDAERLALVAKHVLPANSELMLAERCRWADSAFAWVTTARVVAGNGVAQWWMASCSRDARNWTCDSGVLHQEIEKDIDVEGLSRQVKIRFGAETSLETAESLSSEALRIYVKASESLPRCSGTQGEESSWRALRDSHPLPAPSEEIRITISRESNRAWVWFGEFARPGDVQTGIAFPVPDTQPSGRCWSTREP